MRRLFGLAVMLATAAVAAATATAGSPDPSGPATGRAHALGMVPTFAASLATPWANGAYRATYGSGKLLNHGGPTMTTNATYAIFWQPQGYSFPSGYTSLISQYFTDVTADSGKSSNVYYTATQYSGIKYSSAFKGVLTDTDGFPGNGCSVYSGVSKCFTTAQLETEVSNFVSANRLPRNLSTEYFLFTPQGIGSCDGSQCAYTYYCAYHDWVGSGSSTLVWANQPWVENVSGCDAGHHPNGAYGDAVLNVVSHEHNESVTDPTGTAWYDRRGYENGDKCAWSWGAWLGGSGSTVYNQVINTHHYALQLEYSNLDGGCVETGL
jgi:hypothetical protein